jgi:hypothetical protein
MLLPGSTGTPSRAACETRAYQVDLQDPAPSGIGTGFVDTRVPPHLSCKQAFKVDPVPGPVSAHQQHRALIPAGESFGSNAARSSQITISNKFVAHRDRSGQKGTLFQSRRALVQIALQLQLASAAVLCFHSQL